MRKCKICGFLSLILVFVWMFSGCTQSENTEIESKKTVAEQLLNRANDKSKDVYSENTEASDCEVTDSQTKSVGMIYVFNTNSKKFHKLECSSVEQMKDKNKEIFEGSRDEAVALGYAACKNCNP